VLLNSVSAASRDIEEDDMRLQTKKLCRDKRAVDVMGPVDKGDRIIAKNGANREGSGKFSIPIQCRLRSTWKEISSRRVTHHLHPESSV
jgi:hypothetical protein